MKKICMISYFHGLMDDRIYWKEALTLKEYGYQVVHIGVGDRDLSKVSDEGIKIIQVKKIDTSGIFDKFLTKALFRYKELKAIYEYARNEQADVYHFHDWPLNKIAKRIKRLPHRPIVISDIHDDNVAITLAQIPYIGFFRKVYFMSLALHIFCLEKSLLPIYDYIIFAEPDVQLKLLKFTRSGKTSVIYNYSYYDPNDFILDNPAKEYDLVYSGTITYARGILEIIEATSILKKKIANIKVLVIGFISAEVEDTITKLLVSKDLVSNIIIRKNMPFSEIHKYYLKSKIGLCILHPNTKYKHAIPIKIFEYMSFGLPIIMSKEGSAANYVKNCNTGILVDSFSPKEIADAAFYLIWNKYELDIMSENGRMAVSEKFSWGHEKSKIISIYEQLIL